MGKIVPFRTRAPQGWQYRPSKGEGSAFRRCHGAAAVKPARKRGVLGLIVILVALLAATIHVLRSDDMQPPVLVSLFTPQEADRAAVLPSPRPAPGAMLISHDFQICRGSVRKNCIVDGDTLWIDGEKVRVADINAPEVSSPQCRSEAVLAAQATERLRQLVNAGPFELRRTDRDRDRYGRALRTLHRDGRSLGEMLVAEGLAHRWGGRRENWCV